MKKPLGNLFSFLPVLFLVGCASTAPKTEKKEDVSKSTKETKESKDTKEINADRTYENRVQNDFPTRRAELNLERINKNGSVTFDFIFSITSVPFVHDFLELPARGKLVLTVDGEEVKFSSKDGSQEDPKGSALGIGKLETIRFENVPLAFIKKIVKAQEVKYRIKGRKDSSFGTLTSDNLEVFSDFIEDETGG